MGSNLAVAGACGRHALLKLSNVQPCYFPRVIKNERRGLPPALTRVAAARHTRTGAGSGGPPGHFVALFAAVHENPPFRDHPKMNYAVFRKLDAPSSGRPLDGS